ALLEKAVGRNVPANLSSLLASLRSDYDAGLEAQFNTLMEAAAKSMEDRDFSAAGRKVTEASALPLTSDQSDRLKEFRNTNEKALEDYVRGLIADVETALDGNEFEKARDALAA